MRVMNPQPSDSAPWTFTTPLAIRWQESGRRRQVADNTNPLGLTEGAQVVDREGAELGKIAAVRDGYFKVEVSMGIDYWLRQDIVAESDSECVKLRLPQSEVDDQRIESGAEDLL